jgi:hypothetical protein
MTLIKHQIHLLIHYKPFVQPPWPFKFYINQGQAKNTMALSFQSNWTTTPPYMHAISAGKRHLGPGIIRPLSHKPPYLMEKRHKGYTTKRKYTISGGRDTRDGAPMQKQKGHGGRWFNGVFLLMVF